MRLRPEEEEAAAACRQQCGSSRRRPWPRPLVVLVVGLLAAAAPVPAQCFVSLRPPSSPSRPRPRSPRDEEAAHPAPCLARRGGIHSPLWGPSPPSLSRQGQSARASTASASDAGDAYAANDDDDDDYDDGGIGAMALWEVFRELERRGVVFSVLQPREELTRLLLEARLLEAAGGVGASAGEEGDAAAPAPAGAPAAAPAVAVVAPIDDTEVASVDEDVAPASASASRPARAWTRAAAPTPPAVDQRRGAPPRSAPSLPAGAGLAPPPAFDSIADALAWAGKLSTEEIAVELDFLGVPQDGFDDEPTHSQLARLLARAVTVPDRRPGAKGPGSSAAAAADAAASASLPPPLPQPKSKARQQRLLRELQREGTSSSGSSNSRRRRPRPGPSSPSPSSSYGGEERLLDVDHAREELVALRDRALSAFGELAGPADKRPEGARGGGGGGGGRDGGRGRRRGGRNGDGYGNGYGYDGGAQDLAMRVFEKATRVADGALEWATRAKSMARGAMIAATTSDADVDPRGQGAGSLAAQQKAALQRKSQALLGPRGRRWSKFGGMMARAWAESVWQVVMASAAWAGGGLLPGKYVLLGAGAFSLLLRQGLGTYLATLLVVRTCSSTLRNIIEDEDEAPPA